MKPVSFVQNAVISIQAALFFLATCSQQGNDVTNASEGFDEQVCPARGPPLIYIPRQLTCQFNLVTDTQRKKISKSIQKKHFFLRQYSS